MLDPAFCPLWHSASIQASPELHRGKIVQGRECFYRSGLALSAEALLRAQRREIVLGTQHEARVARYSFPDDPSSRRFT
jgi:hypothetical protein